MDVGLIKEGIDKGLDSGHPKWHGTFEDTHLHTSGSQYRHLQITTEDIPFPKYSIDITPFLINCTNRIRFTAFLYQHLWVGLLDTGGIKMSYVLLCCFRIQVSGALSSGMQTTCRIHGCYVIQRVVCAAMCH